MTTRTGWTPRFAEPAAEAPAKSSAPAVAEIYQTANRLRKLIGGVPTVVNATLAGAVFRAVKDSIEESPRWRGAVSQIAAKLGYSDALLRQSLHALIRPLNEAAQLACKIPGRRQLFAFIMPGNVPGAGLHELVIALIAGCAAMVKTSAAEPLFFAMLAATLRELDGRFGSDFGARIAVFNWGRERNELTRALVESCDRAVALGDDATLSELERQATPKRLIGFGSRLSGAVILREALGDAALSKTARAVALDCVRFDQRGCLSPQHIFVEQRAREFAAQMAQSFSVWSRIFGGRRSLALDDAAAIRRVRETARWRGLGGAAIELWEDRNFEWTVVLDNDASFTASPGFWTVYVSPFSDLADLQRRLEPVRGRVEGFAIIADEPKHAPSQRLSGNEKAGDSSIPDRIRAIVARLGATYICAAGELQSPPLDWPHGGGQFLGMMAGQ